jgi:hypothetical protein
VNGHDLPAPNDGWSNPLTAEQQMRRLNKIAAALWAARDRFEVWPRKVAISVEPFDGAVQISFHVHQPNELADAQAVVRSLAFAPEGDRVRVGMDHHHRWYGMFAGFRAYVVWVEVAEVRDTQGRDQLPAGVGVGNAEADAALTFDPAAYVNPYASVPADELSSAAQQWQNENRS